MSTEALRAFAQEVEDGLQRQFPELHCSVYGHAGDQPADPPVLQVDVRGDSPTPRFHVHVLLERGYTVDAETRDRLVADLGHAAEAQLRAMVAGESSEPTAWRVFRF